MTRKQYERLVDQARREGYQAGLEEAAKIADDHRLGPRLGDLSDDICELIAAAIRAHAEEHKANAQTVYREMVSSIGADRLSVLLGPYPRPEF